MAAFNKKIKNNGNDTKTNIQKAWENNLLQSEYSKTASDFNSDANKSQYQKVWEKEINVFKPINISKRPKASHKVRQAENSEINPKNEKKPNLLSNGKFDEW